MTHYLYQWMADRMSVLAAATRVASGIAVRVARIRRLRSDRARHFHWNPELLKDLGLGHGDEQSIAAGLYERDSTRRHR